MIASVQMGVSMTQHFTVSAAHSSMRRTASTRRASARPWPFGVSSWRLLIGVTMVATVTMTVAQAALH